MQIHEIFGLVRENRDAQLTTEGILEGFADTMATLRSQPDNVLDSLKRTPFFSRDN